MTTAAEKKKKPVRNIVLIAIAVVAVIVGIPTGIYYHNHETSDDAQIEGHILPVMPHVGGYVDKIYVLNEQPVKAGETLFTLDRRELEIKAPAANTPAARLSQMKLITRDFSASEVYLDGTRIDLRLLPRPLLRYSDESQGIIDGALFAFANGTNPEILLVIESTKGTGSPSGWQYGAARMSSAELHLQFKDVEVWTIEGSRRESVDDPYYSRRE